MTAEYRYDTFGNRVEKTIDWDGSGINDPVILRMAIDGWNPQKPTPVGLENFDVLADIDEEGSLTTRYFRGDEVDSLIGRIDSGLAYWYLSDHLGSVRDVLDHAGALKNSVVYDAWGNIVEETDAEFRGRYAWTSREYDAEIELQYNRARYYDATTGRWITQDPLGFDAGDSNLYRYVNNKPNWERDPSGMQQAGISITVTASGMGVGTQKDDVLGFQRDPEYLYFGFRVTVTAPDAATIKKTTIRQEAFALVALRFSDGWEYLLFDKNNSPARQLKDDEWKAPHAAWLKDGAVSLLTLDTRKEVRVHSSRRAFVDQAARVDR